MIRSPLFRDRGQRSAELRRDRMAQDPPPEARRPPPTSLIHGIDLALP
jgi:hypothetical protein